MMLRFKFLLLTFALSLAVRLGFGYITFRKTYNYLARADYGYCVQQTNDGGYIVIGMTDAGAFIGSDIWLIKTDSLGNMIWDKTWGYDQTDESGYYVRQTADYCYITVEGCSGSTDGSALWLVKYDSSGSPIWRRWFGPYIPPEAGWGYCVEQISDESYILIGKKQEIDSQTDIWLIKTDSLGDTLWTKLYGSSSINEAGYSVHRTPIDSGYIIAGTKPTNNSIHSL